MTAPVFTRTDLERWLDADAYGAGLEYACAGRVRDLHASGFGLAGRVQGWHGDHQVGVTLGDGLKVTCDCGAPHPCRHGAALLFAYLEEPERSVDLDGALAVWAGAGERALRELIQRLCFDQGGGRQAVLMGPPFRPDEPEPVTLLRRHLAAGGGCDEALRRIAGWVQGGQPELARAGAELVLGVIASRPSAATGDGFAAALAVLALHGPGSAPEVIGALAGAPGEWYEAGLPIALAMAGRHSVALAAAAQAEYWRQEALHQAGRLSNRARARCLAGRVLAAAAGPAEAQAFLAATVTGLSEAIALVEETVEGGAVDQAISLARRFLAGAPQADVVAWRAKLAGLLESEGRQGEALPFAVANLEEEPGILRFRQALRLAAGAGSPEVAEALLGVVQRAGRPDDVALAHLELGDLDAAGEASLMAGAGTCAAVAGAALKARPALALRLLRRAVAVGGDDPRCGEWLRRLEGLYRRLHGCEAWAEYYEGLASPLQDLRGKGGRR